MCEIKCELHQACYASTSCWVQILQNRENNRELKHEKVILWENFSPLTQKHIFKFQLLSLTLTSE